MRVGIPLFEDQIAPRLGQSQDFLLVEVEDGREVDRRNVLLAERLPERLPSTFRELGIETLICCGITLWCEQCLVEKGIRVISGVMGPAEEALRCFCRGDLCDGQILQAPSRKNRTRPK